MAIFEKGVNQRVRAAEEHLRSQHDGNNMNF